MTLFQVRVDFWNFQAHSFFPLKVLFVQNRMKSLNVYFPEPVYHFTAISYLKPMIQLNISFQNTDSLPIPPTILFSLASLQLTGNNRLGLKKSYQEHNMN